MSNNQAESSPGFLIPNVINCTTKSLCEQVRSATEITSHCCFWSKLGSWPPREFDLGLQIAELGEPQGEPARLWSHGLGEWESKFTSMLWSENFLAHFAVTVPVNSFLLSVLCHWHLDCCGQRVLELLLINIKNSNFLCFPSTTGNLKHLQGHDWWWVQQTDVRKENQLCFSTAGFTAKLSRGGNATGDETCKEKPMTFCSHIPGWRKISREGLCN